MTGPFVAPQRSRRMLLQAPLTVDSAMPWGFVALPWVVSLLSPPSRGWTPGSLLFTVIFSAGFSLFLFLFLYPMKGTRAAVYLDGFRPGSYGWDHLPWIKRRFRSKVLWGEVEYVKLLVNQHTGLEEQLRIFLPGGIEFLFSIRLPDAEFETEVALLILERWTLLGGAVDVEVFT